MAESKSLLVEKQKIEISKFRLNGKILDIGGGGEGIIELYKGEQVVAIDRSKRELEEAPENTSLKIVMDAKELKFLGNTFDTVTAFFTLMYVPLINHKIVLQEIHRVLKLNGEFVLWDLKIPKRGDRKQEFYGLYLEVKINDRLIETGYGTYWKDKEQNMQYYIDLAKIIGFQVIEQDEKEHTFFIRFVRK
jgi:ubiquinone/menaquinone biosynthesis C-methylase UbiE